MLSKNISTKEYEELVNNANSKFPQLEERKCPECGKPLVKGSINWSEKRHVDICVE